MGACGDLALAEWEAEARRVPDQSLPGGDRVAPTASPGPSSFLPGASRNRLQVLKLTLYLQLGLLISKVRKKKWSPSLERPTLKQVPSAGLWGLPRLVALVTQYCTAPLLH